MLNHSFLKLFSRILFALFLFTASSGANAFFNSVADPFIGQTVDLQVSGGGLVALPGVGPGGMTLYANSFIINNFVFESFNGSTGREVLTATFTVNFLDNLGNPVGAGATLMGDFVVQFVGRTDPTQTGVFDLNLVGASFTGLTSLGDTLTISLANLPTAQVSIQANPTGGFDINYLTAFSIDGQYAVNGGSQVAVPGLQDANVVLPAVPEPAIADLAIAGLFAALLVGSLRRRRMPLGTPARA